VVHGYHFSNVNNWFLERSHNLDKTTLKNVIRNFRKCKMKYYETIPPTICSHILRHRFFSYFLELGINTSLRPVISKKIISFQPKLTKLYKEFTLL